MDTVKIKNALDTLSTLLTANQMQTVEMYVKQGLERFHINKSEERIELDCKAIGISLVEPEVDQSLYEDMPF